MNTTALIRSIPFWLLLVLSLAAIGVGGWIATDQIEVMTTTLLDGTATGVEVYAGQSWVVVAGALIAAGVVGLFLTLFLAAARTLLPKPVVEVVEAIDWTADGGEDEPEAGPAAETPADAEADTSDAAASDVRTEDAEEQVVTPR
ncbi:hypothetical protein [Microbacterium tumbae]